MSDATPAQLPAIGRPLRLLLGDLPLELEPATVITLVASQLPAFLQAGAEELSAKDAAIRFGTKQAVRGLLGLMNTQLAAQGWPEEYRPLIPRGADPIEFGLSYLIWFGLLQASQHDWSAEYDETATGIRITGVAPAPAVARGLLAEPAEPTIAGDPAPAPELAPSGAAE